MVQRRATWTLSITESGYNGYVSVRTGPWRNERRLPSLINHIFFHIWWMARCMCVVYMGKCLQQEDAQWEEGRPADVCAMFCWETLHPCGCNFDTYPLPNDRCWPHRSLHGNGVCSLMAVNNATATLFKKKKNIQIWFEKHKVQGVSLASKFPSSLFNWASVLSAGPTNPIPPYNLIFC